ncbi:MAG: hypothetical protein KF723_07525 [Rhizobiaceae bacterium]|nr:hypothetical protein [Rhizobiaceae bacterium]
MQISYYRGQFQATRWLLERLARQIGLVVVAFVLTALPASAQSDWAAFRDIGGVFGPGAPIAAISRGSNRIDLFVTGMNGHVYTSTYIEGRDWTGIGHKWTDIGGVFPAGAPLAALSRTPNRLDVFVTGHNGNVYTSSYSDGGQWTGFGDKWTDIGGVFQPAAPVTAISRNPNQIDLFITGLNGDVYTSYSVHGGPWSGAGNKWIDIGGVFPNAAKISAVSRNPNRLDLFVTGHNGDVYTSWYNDGGSWSGLGNRWKSVGGSFPAGAPNAALSRKPNQLDVFITGHDGVVYTSWSIDGAGGGGGGGGDDTAVLTVVEAVTGYNQPGGDDRCYLEAGDKVVLVMKKDDDPIWVMIEGWTGGCKDMRAWIYNDGKLR